MFEKITSYFANKKRKAPKGFRRMNVHHIMTIHSEELDKQSQAMIKLLLDFMTFKKLKEINLREDHWLVDVTLRNQLVKAGRI